MNSFFARSRAVVALALLGLGATTLLTGCFDHDKEGRDGCHNPKNSVCNTAVTVVQWLRFGGPNALRIIGSAPRDQWAKAFPRFRAVRDGIQPR